MSQPAPSRRILGLPSRAMFRLALVAVSLSSLAWLGVWLTERSLMSSAKKRAMQSWLDDNLNADVSLAGSMRIRLNLLRRSRLTLNEIEVEHPNPIFPGKFALVPQVTAWTPPWAVARLWPGRLDLLFRKMRVFIEENETDEWNIDGLMRPLVPGESVFPFLLPRISDWRAALEDCRLSVKREGYEFGLDLNAEVFGAPDSGNVVLRTGKTPFSFSRLGDHAAKAGSVGPGIVTVRSGTDASKSWFLASERCEMAVDNLPSGIIPFLIPGIPLDDVPGTFAGNVTIRNAEGAAAVLRMEGELRDAPLAIFGLPRNAPISLSWPISPIGGDEVARLRMGPSGFGAFTLEAPLNEDGLPRMLTMRGDVAALDDLPALLDSHSRWPDWLSRTFPSIEWRTGKWLGFGWSGDDMRLSLTRSTAGLNLAGEAGLLGGRVRVALSPGRNDAPVTVAAERLDVQQLGARLSQYLSPAFRVAATGANANLTWQGRRSVTGGIDEWSSGMVLAKPSFDLKNGGEWWQCLKRVGLVLVEALPEWGGGDGSGIIRIAERNVLDLEQLSLVMNRREDGLFDVEFRAYGEASGQVTGWVERLPDGHAEGEIYLAGDSDLLREVRAANPFFGRVLGILADDSLGLRVLFGIAPGEAPVFHFPFLDEALFVRNVLNEENEEPAGREAAEEGEGGEAAP